MKDQSNETKKLFYTTIESVVGEILLVCDVERKLHMLKIKNNRQVKDLLNLLELNLLVSKGRKKSLKVFEEVFEEVDERSGYFGEIIRELNDYFEGGRRIFEVRLNVGVGSDFDRKVWDYLRRGVKYGQRRTYQEIGAKIGYFGSSQAIGGANGRNLLHIIIPCHRVISKSGDLSGYDGGIKAKEWLLEHERRWVSNQGSAL